MSTRRNALITLADFALRSAQSDADQLAIYDAIAIAGEGDEFATLAAHSASAIRAADEAKHEATERQQEFRGIIVSEKPVNPEAAE